MTEVRRAMFVVKQFPDWPAVRSSTNPRIGKHAVEEPGTARRAEVRWESGRVMTAKQLEGQGADLVKAAALTLVSDQHDSSELDIRYHLLASTNNTWVAISLIHCRQTEVVVAFGFTMSARRRAVDLRRRVLDSFTCAGSSPLAPASPPASSLGEEFGYAPRGIAHLVASASGRVVSTLLAPPGSVEDLRARPSLSIAMLGKQFKSEFQVKAGPMKFSGLGGVALWMFHVVETGYSTPFVVAGLTCSELEQDYYLITGRNKPGQLEPLKRVLTTFGCPGPKTPSIATRKSACDVGVTLLCTKQSSTRGAR